VHPLNRWLERFGFNVVRTRGVPREFVRKYERDIAVLRAQPADWAIERWLLYDAGDHPQNFTDHECTFAARWVAREQPARLLDIGSYRWFVLGLLASRPVTSLDVRERSPALPTETVITGDAKRLPLPDASFDMVTSLCTIEHFGLGRYGDEFDPGADFTAIAEMRRVLRPGGCLVLSTSVTRGTPTIVFNAHRIYSREQLDARCEGMRIEDEAYYSMHRGSACTAAEVGAEPPQFDIFMGCWRKL
jgi:SAM-dependent methyltransferase